MHRYWFPIRLIAGGSTVSDVSIGRRGPGVAIGQGSYRFAGASLGEAQIAVPPDSRQSVLSTAALCEAALSRCQEHPRFTELLAGLSGREFPVSFLEGHEYLIEFQTATSAFWISSDVAESLGLTPASWGLKPFDENHNIAPGLVCILGLGQLFVFATLLGQTWRQALHEVVRLYRSLTEAERDSIHRVLQGPHLDSGNLFSLFLQRSCLEYLDNLPEIPPRHWVDQQITWLQGQDRVDLPYSRQRAWTLLRDDMDTDLRRTRLYELLRGYDRTVEQRNIARLSAETRSARQQLVFGRMSRAFHNQATLFADSVLLCPSPEWRALAKELVRWTDHCPGLQSSAGELQLLLTSHDEAPLIQLEGACERFEEAVLEEQKRSLLAGLRDGRRLIENHNGEQPAHPSPAFDPQPIMALTRQRLKLVERLRQSLLTVENRPAAYVVISQRPSPTGSHLLIKINELQEPYLGKSEDLLKLARLSGDRVYGSPDYEWLTVADHWIEAIPLFVKEEVLLEGNRETSRTIVDLAGMEETFREEMADLWARNIRDVLETEYLCLARECIGGPMFQDPDEDRLRAHLAEAGKVDDVAGLGVLVGEVYRQQAADIHRLVETDRLSPLEALRRILLNSELYRRTAALARGLDSWRRASQQVLMECGYRRDFERELAGLKCRALRPRRPLPALHILTTQSAGMTDGYIRTWLEESMALFNIVDDLGLHEAVAERQWLFAERLRSLGEKVIRELGIWVEVEELRSSEQLSEAAAIHRIISRNPVVQEELSNLGVLLEFDELTTGPIADAFSVEPLGLRASWQSLDAVHQDWVLEQVYRRNEQSLCDPVREFRSLHPDQSASQALRRIMPADEAFREDLAAFTRLAARRQELSRLDARHPQLCLKEQSQTYFRRFQRLAKTTARKQIIAERGLNHLSLHPFYCFQASGGGKRYHLLYTPSRVDLGERERESVESWPQWVGGADAAAVEAGCQLYSLINKDVRVFDSLTEPEILKTGENASMTAHFAFSNALSLMVATARHGDFEEMAEQMNRRRDRLIHPAGEGYGGYCVPKDGLFLEFVLSLSHGEKLSQLGVPEALHGAIAELAQRLLDRRPQFDTLEDWQEWSARQLVLQGGARLGLSPGGGFPVFQATRLAQVLDSLGQPGRRDAHRLMSSVTARWALHKMVTGGEQVNRLMPFYKVWLLRQGLIEAARRHPDRPINPETAVVVLTAEYKPDTQDGRFAAGMRKFEILCGTADHLTRSLDLDGQNLAMLMTGGFSALESRGCHGDLPEWLGVNPKDGFQLEQLRALFPGHSAPAEIRLVSTTGLTGQDLLHYTSDTSLETIANAARAELEGFGFTGKEIEANLRSWGPRLVDWDHRMRLIPADKAALQKRLNGRLHALALQVLGPERSYEDAVRGADVLDTGIPHGALLELLGKPARLCRLMLDGHPHSALVIVDGASGARHRAMNRLDVMLWFAAGEHFGREPVYLGIGLGAETVENWRSTMRRHRSRADRLFRALADKQAEQANGVYEEIVKELRKHRQAHWTLAELDKLRRSGRDRDRDHLLSQCLARIGCGVPLVELSFAEFLALGGIYLFNGATAGEIAAAVETYEAAMEHLGARPVVEDRSLSALLESDDWSKVEEFHQERGVESSNKATEDRPVAALQTRQVLAHRMARARALNERKAAFSAVSCDHDGFEESYQKALDSLMFEDRPIQEAAFGTFLAHARHALKRLATDLAHDQVEAGRFLASIDQLITGGSIDLKVWEKMAGGYEEIGEFGRLAQSLSDGSNSRTKDPASKTEQLHRIARGAELFSIILAIESTIGLTAQHPERADSSALWRALADFFAKTIDDHAYEYRPWVYSRGIGFGGFKGESLYQLATEHHRWLYRYLRFLITRHTEVRDLPQRDQDLLLGNCIDDPTVQPIGAEAEGTAERAWRCYGQLRELAFIRNDGFALPEVFADFDPDWIRAEERVNHVIAAPVGRTHFSRALREGPTLARQLEDEGRRGANIIITRKLWLHEGPEYPRLVARIGSGHLYIDPSAYQTALVSAKGLCPDAAAHWASRLPHKGVRVAVRFTRPVLAALVYPFHGDSLYHAGRLEDCGLPYTIQSRFHTWTTYDKAKYPDIFRESGVAMPAEIDWLTSYTAQLGDESLAKESIQNGLKGTPYPGLLAFADQYHRIMVKDAAESGGRGAQVFCLHQGDGRPDLAEIHRATDFIYQLSRRHHVSIQEVVVSSPEHWATDTFMRRFVHRQIVDWGSPVNRRRDPRTPIFGSHRIILSTDSPTEPDASKKWHISHWITLNSKQLITNVGRGGTLDLLRPEYIRIEHRQTILAKLADAGRKVMQALAAYETRAANTYGQETGCAVGADLLGVSYGNPRYMMLDFLITPVFAEPGRLVEVRLEKDRNGNPAGTTFVLQDGGKRLTGTVIDWRVVLIEPNIGVGLWDRVALREEAEELEQAEAEAREPDWNRIGENARIVMKDLHRAGEAYLQALRIDHGGLS